MRLPCRLGWLRRWRWRRVPAGSLNGAGRRGQEGGGGNEAAGEAALPPHSVRPGLRRYPDGDHPVDPAPHQQHPRHLPPGGSAGTARSDASDGRIPNAALGDRVLRGGAATPREEGIWGEGLALRRLFDPTRPGGRSCGGMRRSPSFRRRWTETRSSARTLSDAWTPCPSYSFRKRRLRSGKRACWTSRWAPASAMAAAASADLTRRLPACSASSCGASSRQGPGRRARCGESRTRRLRRGEGRLDRATDPPPPLPAPLAGTAGGPMTSS